MNTIEKRAKNSFKRRYPEGSEIYRDAQIDGYIAGATEQKELDDIECQSMVGTAMKEAIRVTVDNACKWLKFHENDIWDVSDFRKAMNDGANVGTKKKYKLNAGKKQIRTI